MSKEFENMKYVAGRTCTVVNKDEAEHGSWNSGTPLERFATIPAYVLIGEPGAGKTTAFETEAEAQGGTYVTVRDFLTFDDKPEWHGTTLFLDGLDESRIGLIDGRVPLDRIRRKLDRLESPSFRLSCRWAEWFGANDKENLRKVSPDENVTVIRLDPLAQQTIKEILVKNHGVEDADAFIAGAKARGVQELLKNPQTLELLAGVVSQGEWPNSRKETFEQTCRILVREPNREHRLANPGSSDTGKLIEAAGRLCAVQVLTGIAGYTLTDTAMPDSDYPALEEIDGELVGHGRHALGTRLFVGVSEGRFAPVHRQISEFLAAQHIAGLIDHGLPVQRVVALITGFDGELLPTFWNFSSWLAVLSKPSRHWLSRLNASGLIYAEDEQVYSIDERRDILLNLKRQSASNPWCLRSHSWQSGIGRIVSPELEETFREILSNSNRSLEHQPHVMILLQVLADGESLPGLSGLLKDIIVDSSWLPGVRCAALDVFIAYVNNGYFDSEFLGELAEKVNSGEIEDEADEILGILLKALYPKIWSVIEIQNYLRMPKNISRSGEYTKFWTSHVPRESTPKQVCQLLDLIASRFKDYRSFMLGEESKMTRMGVMPLELLDKVLHSSSVAVTVERLLRWLKMASELRSGVPESLTVGIKFRLEWNRDKLKDLVAYSVETCLKDGYPSQCATLVNGWLFGARPFDYGPWCLEMASSESDRHVAEFYLTEALACVSDGKHSSDLTIEKMRAKLSGNAALLKLLDNKTKQFEGPIPQGRVSRGLGKITDTKHQIAWQQQVEAEAQELRRGRGEARLLHRIARAYLGLDEDVTGTTPSERLGNLVGSRADLVAVLRKGLETTLDRADLPDYRRVLRLLNNDRTDALVLPFMAGLDSRERSGRLEVGELNEDQIDLAIMVLYSFKGEYIGPDTTIETVLYRPEWFRTLLRDDPVLVADVLRRCVEEKHRTGKQVAIELYHLARDDDHSEVAGLATLPLLEEFPNADTDHARRELGWLLKAALKNCKRSQVLEVVKKRLARVDLAANQKIHWLTAGYLVKPDLYREDVKIHLKDSGVAFHGVWEFVSEGMFPKELVQEFEADDFEVLIVLIASAIERHGMTQDGWWVVQDLLGTMASIPSPEISETFERLSTKPILALWGPHIADAKARQARKRREHEFRPCDIRQVTKTLDKEDPASAGDLTALLLDVLEDLSKKIRDGSTSDWRQYWNVDGYNRPENPKPEDACRDILLSDLQNRIEQLGIDAQPEGVYAEDNRSDIRASFGGFNVPVEIKRSCHADLWTAIESQLIAKYTRDQGAAGYGIYLVFWFGDAANYPPTKHKGWTPENAVAVKAKLTELLPDRDRHKISICVIDVSLPDC